MSERIRVMLVDDEPLEREGLQLMLRKNRSNVEVVAEARDGQEAIDLAQECKPDLIFMDIKMPEVDGVIAVKEIITTLPMTKCIMVTAFDTFQYAQEVMKYGVKEYLLKPSKKGRILEAFDRMAAEIEEAKKVEAEKAAINHRLERISSLVESEFIVSLMMDYVHEFNMDEWSEWIEVDGEQGFVVVFSFESKSLLPNRQEKTEWYRILKQFLQKHYHHCLIGPLIGFQVPTFFSLKKDGERNLKAKENVVRTFIHLFQKHVQNCRLVAGIGSTVSKLNQFDHSYGEAIYALESVYNHPSASYMTFHPKLKEKRKEFVPFEVEKELFEAVKGADLQKGLRLFDSYFQGISEASQHQVPTIQKNMVHFFLVLKRKMKELGIEEEFPTQFHLLSSATQVKEAAKVQLSNIIERISDWRVNDMKGQLTRAREYIDANYHKAISLEEVAEHVGLSSYYLSKLFKDRYERTFIDYLTDVRMTKAKEYLKDRNLPLKEIAIDIGYKDPNYFSRVFKKETGISPSEYRGKL
ncbi:two-component system response regulator YesN [Evansella vedderi]|uniref:Two-component system response regulator YesN n=1 Tax=Evansella vedderi TaxID=38282 RepID=A0ABT9ZPW2_9BACI|nr:response regulator [Evansella vedderi]MDQ0253275.1 two-component system response regulator YesN [Evansella vedderi]